LKYINISTFQKITRGTIFSNFLNLGSIQLSNTLLSSMIYLIIARKVGLVAFGLFTVSNYFAGLMGTIVNYGTSQSGVKDIAMNKDELRELSSAFSTTLLLRLTIFTIFLLLFFLLGLGDLPNYMFYFFSIPLIFCEVLNPIFLFLGKEKLTVFNIINLIGKILIISLVIFLISGSEDAIWINFIIGTTNTFIYIVLIIYGIIKFRLTFEFNRTTIISLLKSNFYLVSNNISVHLQQSIMVFNINLWGNPLWLGAYAICDRIIGAVKMMTSAISNSIYPKAAYLYKTEPMNFVPFMNRMKKIFVILFLFISLSLMLFAGPVITLINGKPDASAEMLLRIMAFLPTISALNSVNVLDLLIRDHNIYIFRIAMILLILAAVLSLTIVLWGNLILFGTYTLMIETCAVLMYGYTIKKFPPAHVSGIYRQTFQG
jgi:O-antigen/teichoic acid export membrane protein